MQARPVFSTTLKLQQDSKLLWIGSEYFLTTTKESNIGKINIIDIRSGSPKLISSKEVSTVSSVCMLGYPNKPFVACIGYTDGNVEYRSIPDLNIVNSNGGLYLIPEASDDIMMTDLDEFFQNTSNFNSSTLTPLNLVPSVNGLFPVTLGCSKYDSKSSLVIDLPKFIFDKLDDQIIDQLAQLFANITLLSLLNGVDTDDLQYIFSMLPVDYSLTI